MHLLYPHLMHLPPKNSTTLIFCFRLQSVTLSAESLIFLSLFRFRQIALHSEEHQVCEVLTGN